MRKYIKGHKIIEGQYLASDDGTIYSKALNKPLSTFKSQGYKKVTLRTEDGRKQFKVHRIIAETFLDKPDDPAKNFVHHKDFSRDNNAADNLAWVTREENLALGGPGDEFFGPDTVDGISRYGTSPKGENNINAKITNEQAHRICQDLVSGNFNHYRDILEDVGLENTRQNKLLVSRIKCGRDWKEISSQYGIEPSHDIVRKRTFSQTKPITNHGALVDPPFRIDVDR